MVMVIIAGHIDLSVGSVAAFVGIVVAKSHARLGRPLAAGGILLGLAVGALVGAWQGFWVAYVGIPAFIVTLAGMLIFRGVNQFDRQVQHRPGARELPGDRCRLPARGRARAPGYNNLDAAARPRSPASAIVWRTLRSRRQPTQDRRRRRGRRGSPCVADGPHLRRHHRARRCCSPRAARHGLPGLRADPHRPGHRLLVHHQQHHHRPAHLRGRRQPARRRAVRREASSGSTSSSWRTCRCSPPSPA